MGQRGHSGDVAGLHVLWRCRYPAAHYYQSMVHYAAYLRSKLEDGMLTYGLGDWFDIGPGNPGESQLTGKGLTATATYYQDLDTLAKICERIRKDGRRRSLQQGSRQHPRVVQ